MTAAVVFAAIAGCALICIVAVRENERSVARQEAMRRHPAGRLPRAGYTANTNKTFKDHPDLVVVDEILDDTAELLKRFYA